MQEFGISAVLMISAIYVVPCTFVASVAVTHLVRLTAIRFGLTDNPDGYRKLHGRRTPLGGGISVFVSTAAVIAGLVVMSTPWTSELRSDASQQIGLLVAAAILVAVGLVDDWKGMRGRHKLLAQIAVSSIVVASGVVIRRVELLGWSVEFGVFAYPLTMLWIVGAINSLNLLDGIDGLAGTIGAVLSITIGIIAAVNGNYSVSVVAWAFASALCGFLMFNLPPASIFLGDAGSMLIGLVVGTLAIRGSLIGSGTALLTAPLAIWSIPALDTMAAIMRRRLTGRSIYAADRGHLHHRMMVRLGSNARALAVVVLACAVTCMAGLASVFEHDDRIAIATCGGVLIVFLVTGLFGRHEVMLVLSHVRTVVAALGRSWSPDASGLPVQSSFRSPGTEQWSSWWNELTERGAELKLARMRLDLNSPSTDEEFHAWWQRASGDELESCWKLDLPLQVAGRPVGKLSLCGTSARGVLTEDLDRLLEIIALLKCDRVVIGSCRYGDVAGASMPHYDRAEAFSVSHPK